jgi:hypothetical protein
LLETLKSINENGIKNYPLTDNLTGEKYNFVNVKISLNNGTDSQEVVAYKCYVDSFSIKGDVGGLFQESFSITAENGSEKPSSYNNRKTSTLTHARSGSKMYVNKAGTLTTVADNTPAFGVPYHISNISSNLGIPLEVASTNLIPYSNDLTKWTALGNAIITANTGLGPDGVTQAQTVSFTEALERIALSSTSIVDVAFYDTTKDSDGGAWVDAATGKSWNSETGMATGKYVGVFTSVALAVAGGGVVNDFFYNSNTAKFYRITATGTPACEECFRAGSQKFPRLALIVAESNRVTIYDGTKATLDMWMVFNTGSNYNLVGSTITAISAISGEIYVSSSVGLACLSIINDIGGKWWESNGYFTRGGNIASRNTGIAWSKITTSGIVSSVPLLA